MNTDQGTDGACRNYDPELWFPEGRSRSVRPDWETPRAICNTECDMLAACHKWAMSEGDPTDGHGMAAGLNPSERAALRRLRNRNNSGRNAVVSVNEPTSEDRCGSYAGVRAHRKRAEWLCDPCRDARAIYENGRRARVAEAKRQEGAA